MKRIAIRCFNDLPPALKVISPYASRARARAYLPSLSLWVPFRSSSRLGWLRVHGLFQGNHCPHRRSLGGDLLRRASQMRTDRPPCPQAKLVTRRLEGKGFDHRLGFLDAMRGIIHSRIVVGEVADLDFAPLFLVRDCRRSRRLVGF